MTNIMFDAIRDVALHTGIDPSIIERIFSRLILDDDFSYDPDTGFSFAFGLRPGAASSEELRDEMNGLSTNIDDMVKERNDVREALLTAFYKDGRPIEALSKARKASLEYALDKLS